MELARELGFVNNLRTCWRFVRYVLCGRLFSGDPSTPFKQIQLDVQSQATPLVTDSISMSYDVDSVIGYTRSLVMRVGHALSLYSVIDFRHTLTHDNHLKVTIQVNGEEMTIPLHTIPNFCTAKIGQRGMLCVFFPSLWRAGPGDRRIDTALLQIWYDDVIWPAVGDIDVGRVNSIPVTYKAAEAQQKAANNGQYHFSTFDVPGESAEALCHAIERHAEAIAAFRDFFFVIVFRGTKGETRYTLPEDATNEEISDARMVALAKAIQPLDPVMLSAANNKFWIDVAAEFYQPGKTLMLLRSGHATLLRNMFPKITADRALAIVKRRDFDVDHWAQVYQLAGFRWNVVFPADDMEMAEYVQAYTTLKTFTYGLGFKNMWSSIAASDTLPTGIAQLCHKLANWTRVIQEAIDTNRGDARDPNTNFLDGAVRVEVRLPWELCESVLMHRPRDRHLKRMFIAVTHVWIWSAAYSVIDEFQLTNMTGTFCGFA
jgi:hypothetical protein